MLARFERLMEQAVEGGLRRVFSTSLQPIQLAKSAARAMEQAQVVGPRGVEVPNLYRVYVAAEDLQRFGDYVATLCGEVRGYLTDYARERELRPVAEIRVEIAQNEALRTGSVRTQAEFAGLSPGAQREVEDAIEGTRRLRLADLDAVREKRSKHMPKSLRLTDNASIDIALEPSGEVVRLGRAADNDVVVPGTAVSRYHAQLRWVERGWLLYDLDSTNGTWLDETRLASARPGLVQAGSVLRLGDHRVEVRATDRRSGRG